MAAAVANKLEIVDRGHIQTDLGDGALWDRKRKPRFIELPELHAVAAASDATR